MKKSTIFLLISLLCLFFTLSATAHSGRTDSKGGHYDHSTGDYHYHHGYPPHDHPNGECPYTKQASIERKKDTSFPTWGIVCLILFFGVPIICCIVAAIYNFFEEIAKKKALKQKTESETELQEKLKPLLIKKIELRSKLSKAEEYKKQNLSIYAIENLNSFEKTLLSEIEKVDKQIDEIEKRFNKVKE